LHCLLEGCRTHMATDLDFQQVIQAAFDPASEGLKVAPSSGLVNFNYDYVSMALSGGDTIETYTYKSGGPSGTVTGTIVVTYTDNTRNILSTVVRS
jgi:hypothetical protein